MHKQQGIAAFTHMAGGGAIPRLDGHYQALCIGVVAKEHAVNVILPALTRLEYSADRGGIKVSVLARRAGNFIGEVDLPRIGDWGVVVFLQGSHQYPVWLGSLFQTYAGLATGTPGERIDHHDSGIYTRIDPDGNFEWSHPSGSYIRVGSGTSLTARTRRQRKDQTPASETVAYAIPSRPDPTIHIEHSSGTTIDIDPMGKVTVEAVKKVKIHTTDDVSIWGDGNTNIGADAPSDFVALKAALDNIKTIFDAHVHDQSDPPSTSMGPFEANTHYTGNTKAT